MSGDARGTVLITSRSFGSAAVDGVARLREAGYEPVFRGAAHDLGELRDVLPDAIAWIAGTGGIGLEHLELAPRLRVIARYGVGVDSVDLAAARRRGVVVCNTPGANSESVADLALALTLNGLRGVTAGDGAVRSGDWAAIRGRTISGCRVGVVGFGRIGRGYADRVRALGADVVVFDPFLPDDAALGPGITRAAGIDELAHCDVVSLHSPGGETLITEAWLAGADGLLLVNTARADLIDEAAVAGALHSGRLSGYGADTLAGESASTDPSPLLDPGLQSRVVITPHLGAQTTHAIDQMTEMSVDNALAVLRGSEPPHGIG
ncbi:NAD(P)-dependent oxidoreductase [Leucobacter sp.]